MSRALDEILDVMWKEEAEVAFEREARERHNKATLLRDLADELEYFAQRLRDLA